MKAKEARMLIETSLLDKAHAAIRQAAQAGRAGTKMWTSGVSKFRRDILEQQLEDEGYDTKQTDEGGHAGIDISWDDE